MRRTCSALLQQGKIYFLALPEVIILVYRIAIGCSYKLIFIFTGAYHNAASDNAMRDYQFAYKSYNKK